MGEHPKILGFSVHYTFLTYKNFQKLDLLACLEIESSFEDNLLDDQVEI